MSQPQDSEFGPIRTFLWPIRRDEWKLFIPMLIIIFCICFNYSILRNLKDAIVITAKSSGAEVIPFIKVWAILPFAFLLTYFFTKLSNRFRQEVVFYIMVGGFLLTYAVFAFVLYPLRESLHPHASCDRMGEWLPFGCRGMIAMVRNWTFTGFYVMSELWASIVLSVLFWGFINQVTKIGNARRFYGILGVGSNMAATLAGYLGIYFSRFPYHPDLPFGHDQWEQSIMLMVLLVIAIGGVILFSFWYLNRYGLTGPEHEEWLRSEKQIKLKKKMSIRDSFSTLSKSKYLLCIAVLIISYNLVINLVEVIWKDQLKELYPDPADYNVHLNTLTMIMGIVSTIASFFIANLVGTSGWTRTALITPLLMLVTSVGFFIFYFFSDSLEALAATLMGISPLMLTVFFGSAQNCLSKAAKYSVFDATKEMAFIPLSTSDKINGKAAIDGVGSRLGKSGGSIVHQGLLILFGSLSASAPFVAVILLLSIAFWISSTKILGIEFYKLTRKRNEQTLAESGEESTVIDSSETAADGQSSEPAAALS